MARAVFAPMWRRAFRIEVRGTLPSGPAVLVANHQCVVDHFAMAVLTRRPMANLAHREAFARRGIGGFLRFVGAIPVARRGGDDEAIAAAVEALSKGALVCVYPEGDWSPDGRLYRFHTGAARVAAAAGVPLVPIAIEGTLALRKGEGFRLGGPVRITALPPVSGDARGATAAARRAIADATGQELADEWAHPGPSRTESDVTR